MKNILILSFIVLLLNSCFNSTTIENVRGLYTNTYEKDALHYILLKDSTYVHYYRGELGEFWHEDKLNITETNGRVYLSLYNWHVYGKIQTKNSKPEHLKIGSKGVAVRNGEMKMNVDSPSVYNFQKVNETPKNLPVK